ncbi:MAG: retropepsin-like domain-containing protein [Planctomycetes bacterium]|nr:retropepsin-like domain-containing protein [Planctomycetota bacterium]
MTRSFRPGQGLIVVRTEVVGVHGRALLRLALDTGATSSLINAGPLVALGYDPGASNDRVQVTTGSGIEFAPRVTLDRIRALGKARGRFPILAHTLPTSAGVDGLLGLDFLQGWRLTVDFRLGRLGLR